MLKKIVAAAYIVLALYTSGTAQVKLPAPSPRQVLRQEFALGSIQVNYCRPAAKGRKVFGDLVPYGKLWRTGANEATLISFTETVELAGKKIDTGTYALYTIPGIEVWEVILNKGINNWGTDGYKESQDVLRFKLMPVKSKENAETFTVQFASIKPESCTLQLHWEKLLLNIPVTVNFRDKLRQQLEAALLSDQKPYWQAAQFYTEYDKNLPRALDYVTKASEAYPKAFWVLLYKANIQKSMGDVAGALASSKLSMQLAKEAGNEDYVRMNQQLQKELKRQ
ncbi:MAG TPA: DUF2911 domain-containing protein [Ferruginibacter sp.]|nr:DUF2911 domain-containing protein [Ferruginibacter sp.]HMP20482.1 DUF2911 domain-containing protein [Ferruginibacter sp.]